MQTFRIVSSIWLARPASIKFTFSMLQLTWINHQIWHRTAHDTRNITYIKIFISQLFVIKNINRILNMIHKYIHHHLVSYLATRFVKMNFSLSLIAFYHRKKWIWKSATSPTNYLRTCHRATEVLFHLLNIYLFTHLWSYLKNS